MYMDAHHISDASVNHIHQIFGEVPGKTTMAMTRQRLNEEILDVAEVLKLVNELRPELHELKQWNVCLHGDGVNPIGIFVVKEDRAVLEQLQPVFQTLESVKVFCTNDWKFNKMMHGKFYNNFYICRDHIAKPRRQQLSLV